MRFCVRHKVVFASLSGLVKQRKGGEIHPILDEMHRQTEHWCSDDKLEGQWDVELQEGLCKKDAEKFYWLKSHKFCVVKGGVGRKYWFLQGMFCT